MFDYNTETGVIRMYGMIGDEIADTDLMAALEEMGGQDITIELNSEGGNVIDGMSMANQIANYPGAVTVVVDALAASIATVFPMTADRVVAHENSTLMIHRAWTIAAGNAGDLRVTAEVLDKLDGTIAAMYAAKTGGAVEEFIEMMVNETFFTAKEAVDVGLVDEIRACNEPKRRRSSNQMQVAAMLRTEDPRLEDYIPPARPRLAKTSALLQSMNLRL